MSEVSSNGMYSPEEMQKRFDAVKELARERTVNFMDSPLEELQRDAENLVVLAASINNPASIKLLVTSIVAISHMVVILNDMRSLERDMAIAGQVAMNEKKSSTIPS